MCKFFSFVTIPAENKYLYFDWKQRQKMEFSKECDSHSYIVKEYKIKTDAFNAYEYNPLTKILAVDAINGEDDSKQVEIWANQLDFKKIVEPLIIKPIVNPFALPCSEVTDNDIALLKEWDSVWDSVRDSVWASVGAYYSSFFDISYEYDFSSCIKLWESGLVPSYDGEAWRLHSGKDAKIVYEAPSEAK